MRKKTLACALAGALFTLCAAQAAEFKAYGRGSFAELRRQHLGRPLSGALAHDWIDSNHVAGLLLNRFLSEFEQDTWPGKDNLESLLETSEERTLVASLLFEAPAVDDPAKNACEGLRRLRNRALDTRLRQIELDLANHHADSKSDPISLLKERTELQKQLRQPFVLAATAV